MRSHYIVPSGVCSRAPYRPGGRHGHRRRCCVKHNTKHNFYLATTVDWSLVVCENFVIQKDPLLTSLMWQASFKCETPQLKLKSSRTFLAIKRCERTKIGKVIKQSRSSKLRWAHVCAHSPISVNCNVFECSCSPPSTMEFCFSNQKETRPLLLPASLLVRNLNMHAENVMFPSETALLKLSPHCHPLLATSSRLP
jgi:hypothetical protein